MCIISYDINTCEHWQERKIFRNIFLFSSYLKKELIKKRVLTRILKKKFIICEETVSLSLLLISSLFVGENVSLSK